MFFAPMERFHLSLMFHGTCPDTPKKIKPIPTPIPLCVGGWPARGKQLLGVDVGHAMGEREAETGRADLLDVRAADVVALEELDDAENVDRPEPGTVAGGHVGVEGIDGVGAGHLAVLLVHVVGAGARVVPDPDAKVLDLEGVLLKDLLDLDNLASGTLQLGEAAHKVPVPALCHGGVGGKDQHAVQLGRRVGLRGKAPADDLILVKTT
jgi:hypothetical protein